MSLYKNVYHIFLLFAVWALAQADDSSFDSLISSQCKAKCLSMYPWNFDYVGGGVEQQIIAGNAGSTDETRIKRSNGADGDSGANLWASLLPNSNKIKKKRLRVRVGPLFLGVYLRCFVYLYKLFTLFTQIAFRCQPRDH